MVVRCCYVTAVYSMCMLLTLPPGNMKAADVPHTGPREYNARHVLAQSISCGFMFCAPLLMLQLLLLRHVTPRRVMPCSACYAPAGSFLPTHASSCQVCLNLLAGVLRTLLVLLLACLFVPHCQSRSPGPTHTQMNTYTHTLPARPGMPSASCNCLHPHGTQVVVLRAGFVPTRLGVTVVRYNNACIDTRCAGIFT